MPWGCMILCVLVCTINVSVVCIVEMKQLDDEHELEDVDDDEGTCALLE